MNAAKVYIAIVAIIFVYVTCFYEPVPIIYKCTNSPKLDNSAECQNEID